MILYALYHGGHLPVVLVHKMTVHPDEEAVLLVGNQSSAHIGKAMDMTPMLTLFKKIVYFNASFGCNIDESVDAVEKAIREEFDQCFLKENLVLEDYSKIYNLVDIRNSFGIYLSLKNISWYVYDDTPRKYEKFEKNPERIYKIDTVASTSYNDCVFQRKIFQAKSNPLISVVTQEDFNHITKIEELNDCDKAQITGMYGLECARELGICLMLPSSRAHLITPEVKSDDSFQHYFYSNENAYYFANGIILDLVGNIARKLDVKPHPSVTQTLSNESAITIYPRYFPAEFMPFIKELKYDTVVGFTSTSIKNLPKLLDIPKVISYSLQFMQKSYLIFRLYLSYVICHRLFSGKFVSFGIEKNLMNDINLNAEIDFPVKSDYKAITSLNKSQPVTIIDNSAYTKEDYNAQLVKYIQKSGVNDVIVVINSKDDYAFIHEDLDFTDFMIPVEIHKKVCADHAVGNFQNEIIYFFCKNEEIRNKIRNFRYCRHLYHTGIELSVMPLTEAEMIMYKQQMFFRREKRKELALLKQLMNDSDKNS